ncbi:SH3 domain-containing protein 19 [Bagarius yarrelli]|uniref:SH3 domain-containing protein 19 n=1 Tax=Bagarius yarrelli TaxID=175774 RepID=A0A556VC57_BAGYA|nr:SH3 domain-containing protein 19 [Bagarius yarrelli]
MAALYSDRNIRGKIQDFEKQLNTTETSIPTPRPRNTKRPTVAPKPIMTPRASVSSTTEEETNTQLFPDRVISTENTPVPSAVIPRPQIPRRASLNLNDQFTAQTLIKAPPQLPPRPSLRRATALNSQDEDTAFSSPPFSSGKQPQYNSQRSTKENDYVEDSVNSISSDHKASFTNRVIRKPTIIRVPSKQEKEVFGDVLTTVSGQKAIGDPPPSLRHKESFRSVCDLALPSRPNGSKVLPSRPPSFKSSPGRPPPPRNDSIQRNSTLPSNKPRRDSTRKSPVLPPRPNPGHWLYNKYTLEIPHGIAEHDYNGMHTGELSFQQKDSQTFECQVGDAKGSVNKSCMKIITPLGSYSNRDCNPGPQNTSCQTFSNSAQNGTLQVQALYDFTPEGPGELGLRAGDILNNVEQMDSKWYLATSKGITGFFPINYVKVLSRQTALKPTPTPAPQNVRFDFEGEHSDELSFTEGQVIRLLEYARQDWARGEIGGHFGIFPLNFVEVLEDQSGVPLPVERVRALYDFTGETNGDLSFLRGDV